MSADRVLDTVLSRLDTTPQRRSRWPARRIDTLNSFARGVGVAAAVILVAVLAISLSSNRGIGAPGPTASTQGSPGFSHHPAGLAPSPDVHRVSGDYTLGWHAKTVDGISMMFDIPAPGWEHFETILLNKSAFGPQGAEGILMSAGFPDGLEADPCPDFMFDLTNKGTRELPASFTTHDVALAVARTAGVEVVTGPTDLTVGGRPATFVSVTVREDVGCPPGYFYNWKFQQGGAFWFDTPVGTTIRVWVVDVDGKLLFLEGATHPDAPAVLTQQIESIVDSIKFE